MQSAWARDARASVDAGASRARHPRASRGSPQKVRVEDDAWPRQSVTSNKGWDAATRHHLANEVHISAGRADDISTSMEIEDGAIAGLPIRAPDFDANGRTTDVGSTIFGPPRFPATAVRYGRSSGRGALGPQRGPFSLRAGLARDQCSWHAASGPRLPQPLRQPTGRRQ